jgi:hypothetical protein
MQTLTRWPMQSPTRVRAVRPSTVDWSGSMRTSWFELTKTARLSKKWQWLSKNSNRVFVNNEDKISGSSGDATLTRRGS